MEEMTPADLLFRGFPNEFGILLNHSRVLRLDDKPDYPSLHLFIHEDYQYEEDHCERPVCFFILLAIPCV